MQSLKSVRLINRINVLRPRSKSCGACRNLMITRDLQLAANSGLFDNNCWVLRKSANARQDDNVTRATLGRYDQKHYRPIHFEERVFQRTWADVEEMPPNEFEEQENQNTYAQRQNDRAAKDRGRSWQEEIPSSDTQEPNGIARSKWYNDFASNKRFDDIYYKPKHINERVYTRTWMESQPNPPIFRPMERRARTEPRPTNPMPKINYRINPPPMKRKLAPRDIYKRFLNEQRRNSSRDCAECSRGECKISGGIFS